MFLKVEIDTEEIVNAFNSSVGNEEMIEMIREIDLDVREIDFSLDLIKTLIRSLSTDFSKQEFKTEMERIIKEVIEEEYEKTSINPKD